MHGTVYKLGKDNQKGAFSYNFIMYLDGKKVKFNRHDFFSLQKYYQKKMFSIKMKKFNVIG